MSYSICISCEHMVPAYEKYCSQCLKRWPNLHQDQDFWKNYYYTWEEAKRIAEEEKVRP